jgi:hypothetical protein
LDEENNPKSVGAEEAIGYFKASINEPGHPVSKQFSSQFELSKAKMFAKSPLPPIKGRRQESLKFLMALKDLHPASAPYCMDIIKIIREFDDLDEGTLYELARINLEVPKTAYEDLVKLVPENVINSILSRASQAALQEEMLLLGEELQIDSE